MEHSVHAHDAGPDRGGHTPRPKSHAIVNSVIGFWMVVAAFGACRFIYPAGTPRADAEAVGIADASTNKAAADVYSKTVLEVLDSQARIGGMPLVNPRDFSGSLLYDALKSRLSALRAASQAVCS